MHMQAHTTQQRLHRLFLTNDSAKINVIVLLFCVVVVAVVVVSFLLLFLVVCFCFVVVVVGGVGGGRGWERGGSEGLRDYVEVRVCPCVDAGEAEG